MPRSRYATMHRSIALVLGLLGLSLACNVHEPRPAFRAGIWIGDRGISVPLPPPSLHDAPKQEVEIEGEVTGQEALPDGTIVHVLEHVGDQQTTAVLPSGSSVFSAELVVDLTDNCFELWLEAPDGRTSDQPAFFRARITEGDDVVVEPGCD